jgi:predicted metal-dependent hydrolase
VLHVEPQSRGHVLRLGGMRGAVEDPDGNVRTEAELALRAIAARDLVPRIHVLAGRHALAVGRVSIRNQQSRWGSCSRRGTIALNFRLVQTPPGVCDYVLLHELMHLRQPNHSRRFWRLVQEACPGFPRRNAGFVRRAGRCSDR